MISLLLRAVAFVHISVFQGEKKMKKEMMALS